MSYREIHNLFKQQTILLFKECFAGEKIHGTSSHMTYHPATDEKLAHLTFFPGGAKYDHFMLNFPEAKQLELLEKFSNCPSHLATITIYGESYGGSMQRMSATYGPTLKFIAFEVLIGEDIWLSMDRAENYCNNLGLEFVHYKRGPATIEWLNEQRDADSIQAIRNGMGPGHKREGIVIHPVVELLIPHGDGRIIAKHKRDDFAEFAKQPRVEDAGKAKRLFDAEQICDQWIVAQRLLHVLDAVAVKKNISVDSLDMKNTKEVIDGMVADLQKEGSEEIEFTPELLKVIGNRTVKLYKEYLNDRIKE